MYFIGEKEIKRKAWSQFPYDKKPVFQGIREDGVKQVA